MSEFHFEYKCISMSDNGKNTDKALDFYLFQNYDNEGAMTVQVHVPSELQSRYCGAYVYRSIGGIEVPEDLEGLNGDVWEMQYN